MPDGSYVVASGGLLTGTPIRFVRDEMDVPLMELQDAETVRWLSEPA